MKVSMRTRPRMPITPSHRKGRRNLRSHAFRPCWPSRPAHSSRRSFRIPPHSALQSPPRYIYIPMLVGIAPVTRMGETPRPVASVTAVSLADLAIIEIRPRLRITAVIRIAGRIPAGWPTIEYKMEVRIRRATKRPYPVRGAWRGVIRRADRVGVTRWAPRHFGRDKIQ